MHERGESVEFRTTVLYSGEEESMEAEARDHLNGVFARRVRQRLVEIDHGPAWLANQLNKDPSTVAGYAASTCRVWRGCATWRWCCTARSPGCWVKRTTRTTWMT